MQEQTNNAPAAVRATVVITTRNRKEELRVAIASALRQTARPEVLVIDDGSTDGTAELVRAEFPDVSLHRYEVSQGLIGQRNNAARLARGNHLFSIDDDAELVSPHTVEQTLADFEHPRVAAVAIPYVNVRQDKVVRQRPIDPARRWVFSSFIGTAHALRRDVFLSLGGYRAELVHQGEEDDFCTRLYDAGYVVRAGTADPIHHYESPNRDPSRMTYYGQRNNILYAWQNVPLPHLLAHLPGTAAKGLLFSARIGKLWLAARGQAWGLGRILCGKAPRRPVRRETYRLVRELRKRGGLPLSEVEQCLPPLPDSGTVV